MVLSDSRCEIILALAENRMNASKVGRKLFMHRNNVIYHCDRIKAITGKDPLNFYDLWDLVQMVKGEPIDNGVTVQAWVSVKDDRKPKDRKNYFIAYVFGDSDMHFFGEAKYHAYEGNGLVDRPHFSNEGVDGMRVTHWMEVPKLPLPPLPKGDE